MTTDFSTSPFAASSAPGSGEKRISIAILNRYNLLLTVRGENSHWELPSREVDIEGLIKSAVSGSMIGGLGVSEEHLPYFDCIHQTSDFLAFRFMGDDAILNNGIMRAPSTLNWQWQTSAMLFKACRQNLRQHYELQLAPVLRQKRFIGY